MSRPSIESMRAHAADKGGMCLSEAYKNQTTNYKWKCREGHEWKASWQNIRNKNSWCMKCYRVKQAKHLADILAAGEARCLLCQQMKKLDEFPKSHCRRNGQSRYAHCLPCHGDYQRARKLRNFFNLSVEDYETINKFQKGTCFICGHPPKKNRLAVDHDHKTGLIRGLLCPWCNGAIGVFRDDMEQIERLYRYFKDPPASIALGTPRFGKKGRSTNKAATIAKLNKSEG